MDEIIHKEERLGSAKTHSNGLLILSQTFWPEPIGTPLYATDLAKWFVDRGIDVAVLTGRPYYPQFKLYPGYEGGEKDKENFGEISIFRIPTYVPVSGSLLSRALSEGNFLLRTVLRIVTGKVQRSNNIISFSPSIMGTLAGIFAKRRNGRHVAVVHDIQSGLAVGVGMVGSRAIFQLIEKIEKFILNRVDAIIVLTDEMKRTLEQKGVCKQIEILPIWVDPNKLFPLPMKEEGGDMVLYSGNLGHKQGLDQVLSLAKILDLNRPDLKVRIRGSGSQFDAVQNEIIELGIKNTELCPLLPLEGLNEGLAEGRVHLVPQNPETADFSIPSKVYNIMAAGRPFVCTASPGSRLWALQEETSAFICTPPYEPQAFAEAVMELIDDPQRCKEMGAHGRQYVERFATRDVILSRYAEICGLEINPPKP